MNELLKMLIEELKKTLKVYPGEGALTIDDLLKLTEVLKNIQYIVERCEW